MKLHSDSAGQVLRVTAYDDDSVTVAERTLRSSFVLTPDAVHPGLRIDTVESLRWDALEMLRDADLEVLVLGCGSRQRFASAEFHAELAGRRIGLEVMSTPAACRTYNILVAEGRRVAAVLLLDGAATR